MGQTKHKEFSQILCEKLRLTFVKIFFKIITRNRTLLFSSNIQKKKS